MNDVGKNIKDLRKKIGTSQETLAQKLHVTRQAVSQWETGHTQPDLKTLDEIADFFNVDILTVIYGEKKKAVSIAPHRRKYKKGLIVFGVMLLVMLLLVFILKPTIEYMYYRFIAEAFVRIYMVFSEPLLYLFVGLFAANGISLGWDLCIRTKSVRWAVFTVSIAFLVFYSIIPLLLILGTTAGDHFLQKFWLFFWAAPVLFLLPGIGLHFGRKVIPSSLRRCVFRDTM